MDTARQLAITSCGRCGQPEESHPAKTGTDEELRAVAVGACAKFVASDASVIYQQHIGLAAMAPRVRRDGQVGKRSPLCDRCGQCGHRKEACPF